MYRAAVAMSAALVCGVSGCSSPGDWARMVRVNDELKRKVDELEREASRCRDELRTSEGSAARLAEFGEDRPVDLFAPVKLEIDKLTRAEDYDGKPGDDGVTVYLQPLDADGNVVKVPGRIRIQLLDNADLSNPRVVHVCEFADPEELRQAWHGRFLTNHYTLKCFFPPAAALPGSGELLVTATFVDFLTGRELKADKVVRISSAVGANP
jgi:hypothetical protein